MNPWLASRLGVMLRAASEGQRERHDRREHRADEGHDDGLQQLQPDVAVLPFVVVEDVVPGERGVRLRRIDARTRDDQRDDFAKRLSPERRIGVEHEIGPAEEAPPDHHLVALHFGAAGNAERDIGGRARLALLDPVGQRRARRHGGVPGDIEDHRFAAARDGDQAWRHDDPAVAEFDGRLDDRFLAHASGRSRCRLARCRRGVFGGRRARGHEGIRGGLCRLGRRGPGLDLPLDGRHLLDHPIRIGIGPKLRETGIADGQIAVLELDIRADLVGNPVGEVGAGKPPVGLLQYGADREEPPAVERVENAGEDADRGGIALPEG